MERSQGLVRPNYLSGIFGGIRLDQYAAVRMVEGVQVAAPIAMIGYVLQNVSFGIDLRPYLGPAPRQVFRVSAVRTTDRGLSRLIDVPAGYVYVTSGVLQPPTGYTASPNTVTGPTERLETGRRVVVCPLLTVPAKARGPFDPAVRNDMQCVSRSAASQGGFGPGAGGAIAAFVRLPVPFLIAAIDPAAEAALLHVDATVDRGRYLRADDQPTLTSEGASSVLTVPVLVSSRGYIDASDEVTIRRLGPAAASAMTAAVPPAALTRRLDADDGPVVVRKTIDAATAYGRLTTQLMAENGSFVESYWRVSPVGYREQGGRLSPVPVTNADSVWASSLQTTGYVRAPIEAADSSFRALTPNVGSNKGSILRLPVPHAVGEFDPAKLPGFSALSAVPEEAYRAPVAAPADTRSRRLLDGQDLLPNGNFAGYLEQPPLLLTTLASLRAFTDPAVFTPNEEPISVIRVRVAGVTGSDPVSRERIRLVAQQIAARTGLDVDITAGSSPTNMTIDLPAGKFGRPALTLNEGWTKKGVAVAILAAIDRKSFVLFALILAVCALLVANAASAAVRARHTELGVLACIGWRPRKLFAAAMLELARWAWRRAFWAVCCRCRCRRPSGCPFHRCMRPWPRPPRSCSRCSRACCPLGEPRGRIPATRCGPSCSLHIEPGDRAVCCRLAWEIWCGCRAGACSERAAWRSASAHLPCSWP